MNRYTSMGLTAIVACLLVSCGGAGDTDGIVGSSSPNILILYLDDLGFNDLGAYGSEEVSTPNLDEFARTSVKFTRHYADSTCSPSRAALISGQFPARLGFSPDGPGISPQTATLPRELKELGYSTHHVGKWHMGHISRLAWPDSVGFDTWFGFLSQWLMREAYEHPHSEDVFSAPTYFDPWLDGNDRSPKQYPGHLSDILGEHTINLVKQLGKQCSPWFINHWFYLPHTPIQPAPRFASRYEDSDRGRSLAMLAQLDDTVGRILEVLDSTGQVNNTVVVIAGDNGGANIHRNNNLPFYGKKAEFTEGGVRTPLMVRWPGQFPAGKLIEVPVSIVDVMPTLLRAAGSDSLPPMDGVDLSAFILDNVALPKRNFFWENHLYDLHGFSVLSDDGRWRLSSHLLNWPTDRNPVLNDLHSEPTGETNVAAEHPEKTVELVSKYEEWFVGAHTVKLDYDKLNNRGLAVLTGDDLQRAPGFGPFTFAVGVVPGQQGESAMSKIVSQPGVWELVYESASHQLEVEFGSYRLTGTLENSQSCQSVIVAAEFHRRLTNWPDSDSRIRAKLYVNSVGVDQLDEYGALDVAESIASPTYIGSSATGDQLFPGILGEPVLLNSVSSDSNYFPPKLLHEMVCGSDSQ